MSTNKDTIKWNKWRSTHREEQNKYCRELAQKYKLEIFGLLGNKCCKCGFSDLRILQIDHVNGGGYKERKGLNYSSRNLYRFILTKIKQGSKDYQLMCPNCNWIKKVENNE